MQVDIADVDAIGAGGTHALAVKTDGTVSAWGNNNTGQLGSGEGGPGSPKTSATPLQADGLDDATTAAGGYVHSLAPLGDKTARAWGRNAEGQLDDGTTTSSRTPVQITGLDAVGPTPSVPASYRYDGDGTRIASVTNGDTGHAGIEQMGGRRGAQHVGCHDSAGLVAVVGEADAGLLWQAGPTAPRPAGG